MKMPTIFTPSTTIAEPYLCSSISPSTAKSGVSLDTVYASWVIASSTVVTSGLTSLRPRNHTEVAIADDAVELAAMQHWQVADIVFLHEALSERDGLLAPYGVGNRRHVFGNRRGLVHAPSCTTFSRFRHLEPGSGTHISEEKSGVLSEPAASTEPLRQLEGWRNAQSRAGRDEPVGRRQRAYAERLSQRAGRTR